MAVVAKPGGRRDAWLYADLLTALGKTYLSGELQRAKSHSLAYCSASLQAEDITDIVLIHGEWSRHQDLTAAGVLAEAIGVRLWVTVHGGITARPHEALASWAGETVAPSEFWRVWRQRPVPTRSDEEASGQPAVNRAFPKVPATDFLTFRADAQRTLRATEFAVVDRLYRSAFSAAREGLGRTEESVVHHVHAALASAPDGNARTVVLRAVQAAAFASGMLIEVDVGGVLRAIGQGDLLQLSDQDWQKVASAV